MDHLCTGCGEECAPEPDSFCVGCWGEAVDYGMHYEEAASQEAYTETFFDDEEDWDWVDLDANGRLSADPM